MIQIFISYSRRDRQFAKRLSESLQATGLDVWIDLQDIHAGSKWGEAIQEGLDSSQAMIVIISPDSMASENVKDEWQYFFDHKKPIIPVLFKSAKIHFQLNRVQHIDFHSQPYDEAFAALCEQLEHRLAMEKLRNRTAGPVVKTGFLQLFWRYRPLGILAVLALLFLVGLIVYQIMPFEPDPPVATPTLPDNTSFPGSIQTLASNSPENFTLSASDFNATVIIPFAFLRTGPGVQFGALATALEDEVFPVIGQAPGFNADNKSITWYMIKHTSDRDLWISSEVVSVNLSGTTAGGAGVPELTKMFDVPRLTSDAPVLTLPSVPTVVTGGQR